MPHVSLVVEYKGTMETILNNHVQIIATKDVMILKRHGWMQMGSHTSKLIAVAQELISFTREINFTAD